MSDLTYKNDGLHIRLYANTPAGEAAFNEIARHEGFEGGVFYFHLLNGLKAQLRKAGITISQREPKHEKMTDEQLLRGLGL